MINYFSYLFIVKKSTFLIGFILFFTQAIYSQQIILDSINLEYIGSFRLPEDRMEGYQYGGTAIAYNEANNSLFIRGHDWYQLVGEVSIPELKTTIDPENLNPAAILQSVSDISDGHLGEVGQNGSSIEGPVIGGLLVYKDKIIGTNYIYYDAGNNAKLSHFTSGLNLNLNNDFKGMFKVGSYPAGFVAGYMTYVPSEWQQQFGGTVLTGLGGVPIISRTSYGPSVTVFNPADMEMYNPVPATMLLAYTEQHPNLGQWENETNSNPIFNMTSQINGIAFPKGAKSVLFFGSTGFGIPCYGLGTNNMSLDRMNVPGETDVVYCYDPASDSKGCHAYPYSAFVWAYYADDLINVANGTFQPWDIYPYKTWKLELPYGTEGQSEIGGVAYDSLNNRIFISQKNAYGASPLVHVFQLDNSNQISKSNEKLHNYFVLQNYPNPFSSFTTISFNIPVNGYYTLNILDVTGREIVMLLNCNLQAGHQKVQWNGINSAGAKVGRGVYFYELKTGDGYSETKKMVLIE
jgi:hypothetical protein